jgi:hypothetical protein
MDALSKDDEIRAAIIREAISRVGLHKSGAEEGKNRDQLPEQAPTRKREMVDETATGGCGAEIVKDKERSRLYAIPWEGACTEHVVSQLGAVKAKGEQQGIEDRSAREPSASAITTLPPYLNHFFSQALTDASCRSIAQQAPAQQWNKEDFALSPLEAELVSLREALALSTQREESSFQMLKALRIQLHKAYRMIALQRAIFSLPTLK